MSVLIGMRVLIAEDDPVSRRVVEATVRKWNYDVVCVSDGNQALGLLRGFHQSDPLATGASHAQAGAADRVSASRGSRDPAAPAQSHHRVACFSASR